MSDYLAVGGVSAVLKALLTSALSDGGPSTVLQSPPGITNLAPDLITTGQDEPAQLNLFMYYASINPALRNLDLPSMGSSRRAVEQSATGHQSALPDHGLWRQSLRSGDPARLRHASLSQHAGRAARCDSVGA